MKSGYVALVGRPNVGKSTLMNKLIGQKIAITSKRPQTTRKRIETIYTDERGQLVFIDTPGIHEARTELGEYMSLAAREALSDADVVLWLAEPAKTLAAEDALTGAVISKRKKEDTPLILLINKKDTLTGDESAVEELKELYSELAEFDGVIAVSALTGEGIEKLLEMLFEYVPEGPCYYDGDTVTEIPLRELAGEFVREELLRFVGDEIPHGTAVKVESMKRRRDGAYDIEADIITEKESHKGIIIGRGGAMLKRIGTAARHEIEKELGIKANLRLFVKVRKKWRDNDTLLRSYGYDRKISRGERDG